MNAKLSRRQLLKTASVAAAAVPYFVTASHAIADEAKSAEKNDRPLLGAIGVGGQGRYDSHRAKEFGDFVAICDVDRAHSEQANQELASGKAQLYGDYHKLLERKDVEAVIIATPDHRHTNIAIRLGRRLNWNPETEQIVGDDAANKWLSREQRKGFEIVV